MRQKRFIDWKEAHSAAVAYANETKHDVALRIAKEYGKTGYNISLASRNDSDYYLAEIVKPGDPA
jgi:hypothetical protein